MVQTFDFDFISSDLWEFRKAFAAPDLAAAHIMANDFAVLQGSNPGAIEQWAATPATGIKED